MRLLTAVIKDEEVQQYISENEDSAYEFLKKNFKVEDIYNYVVENINSFLSDDLEVSYENIKAYARDHVLRIISEGSQTSIINESESTVLHSMQVAASKAVDSGDESAIVNMAKSAWSSIGDSAKAMSENAMNYASTLSGTAAKTWAETIQPAMDSNPTLAPAIALVGVAGLGASHIARISKTSKK